MEYVWNKIQNYKIPLQKYVLIKKILAPGPGACTPLGKEPLVLK